MVYFMRCIPVLIQFSRELWLVISCMSIQTDASQEYQLFLDLEDACQDDQSIQDLQYLLPVF